jgi:hypothetical protein
MSYMLFLDDVRRPSVVFPLTFDAQWKIARNYAQFVQIITENGLPEIVSFDHDLADEHYPFNEPKGGTTNPRTIPYESYKEKTGMDAAKWLVHYCDDRQLALPDFNVHSMNPIGRENIKMLLTNYKWYHAARERQKSENPN